MPRTAGSLTPSRASRGLPVANARMAVVKAASRPRAGATLSSLIRVGVGVRVRVRARFTFRVRGRGRGRVRVRVRVRVRARARVRVPR